MLGNNDSVALEKFLEELSMQEQERIRTMPVKESVVETLKENKRKAEARDAENRKQPHVKNRTRS